MTEAMLAMIRFLCLDKAVHQMHKLGVPKLKSLEALLGEMGSTWLRYRECRCTYALAHAAKRMYTSTIWEVCGYVRIVIATADSCSSLGCSLFFSGTFRIFGVRKEAYAYVAGEEDLTGS